MIGPVIAPLNPNMSEFWEQILDAPLTKTCGCEGDCDCPTMTVREALQAEQDMAGIPKWCYGRTSQTATGSGTCCRTEAVQKLGE